MSRKWCILVFLRGHAEPVCLGQDSRESATATVTYVAQTWLRFPPEARPASCWIVADTRVAPKVDEMGVENVASVTPLAVFDPREILGLQVTYFTSSDARSDDAPDSVD